MRLHNRIVQLGKVEPAVPRKLFGNPEIHQAKLEASLHALKSVPVMRATREFLPSQRHPKLYSSIGMVSLDATNQFRVNLTAPDEDIFMSYFYVPRSSGVSYSAIAFDHDPERRQTFTSEQVGDWLAHAVLALCKDTFKPESEIGQQ